MRQCDLFKDCRREAVACFLGRLVYPYTISSRSLSPSLTCRRKRKTLATPAHWVSNHAFICVLAHSSRTSKRPCPFCTPLVYCHSSCSASGSAKKSTKS